MIFARWLREYSRCQTALSRRFAIAGVSQTAILFQAQSANEEKSPEGWAATRIYSALEELEMASRPEPGPEVAWRDSQLV